jgi:peptide/nickel transport system ATP-binding protein
VTGKVILEVEDLGVDYASSAGTAKAVDRVNFELSEREFLAVVGESGCGKSTLLFAIARLLTPPATVSGGRVLFSGQNMVAMSDKALRALRWRDLSVVMQSAMNALNPVTSIGAQFADAMKAHGEKDAKAVRARSEEVLSMVGIDPVHLDSYAHQLSGGMRQRAMIAMALLFSPELILMDEPTSALDVVAQRSLMVQIKQLQADLGFAIIFVTHDMSLVAHFSDRVAVMYAGQVVETRPTRALFAGPLHPYTRGLLDSFPSVYGPRRLVEGIAGSPPDLTRLPPGCNFAPRCPKATPRCAAAAPAQYQVDDALVRCLLYEEPDRRTEGVGS